MKKIKEDEPILEKFRLSKIDGIGPTKEKRMNDNGIKYLQDICMLSPHTLTRITNGELPEWEKIWIKTKEKLESMGAVRKSYVGIKEDYEYEKNLERLSLGCETLDYLFGGGVPKESLTEFFGKFGSGKTQILITIAVEAIQRGKKVILIDCENTFKVERFLGIARARGYIKNQDDEEKFFNSFRKMGCSNSLETRKVLENLTECMLKDSIDVILVDGVIGQIRKEYIGRSELSDRQQYLKPFMERLGSLPMYLRCWVFFSNQVTETPDSFGTDPIRPIGGNVVGHEATYRVYFSHFDTSDVKWRAKIWDSPEHSRQELVFKLGAKGVEDNEEQLAKIKKLQDENVDYSELKEDEKENE